MNNLTLCGTPYQFSDQFSDKAAANRVHKTAESFKKEISSYNDGDIAGSLDSRIKDTASLVEALNSGKTVDQNGKNLDKHVVKQELAVVLEDLNTIKGVADEVSKKTGKDELDNGHGKKISLSRCISEISTLAAQLKQHQTSL